MATDQEAQDFRRLISNLESFERRLIMPAIDKASDDAHLVRAAISMLERVTRKLDALQTTLNTWEGKA